MNTGYPKRKPNRLTEYDYSKPGAYFLTLCVENRKCILSEIAEESVEKTDFTSVHTQSTSIYIENTPLEREHQTISAIPVGATIGRPHEQPSQTIWVTRLTSVGTIVDTIIHNIPLHYPMIAVDTYVIMPNHIHIILIIRDNVNGRAMLAPTMHRVVQQFKGIVTKRLGYSIWQKLFYDRVIRDKEEYRQIVRYIHENPKKWMYDELYTT